MRHRQPPPVEPDVAPQGIEKAGQGRAEASILELQLIDRLLQAVGDRDLAAAQPAFELPFVVALHRIGRARVDHAHGDPKHVRRVRAAIDEVAHKHRLAARGRRHPDLAFAPILRPLELVAESLQQKLQFVGAAVHVADDVERAGVAPLVGPERLAHHFRCVARFRRRQLPDLAETFTLQPPEPLADLGHHPVHDLGSERTVRPLPIAFDADVRARVDHHRDRQRVPLACELHPRLAVGRADVGSVDDRQLAVLQPLLGDRADELEGVGRDALIGLIVADEGAADVGGDDLRRQEVPGREGGLARTTGADEDHQGEVGDLQACGNAHRVNTPICVGAPRASSTGPTSLNRTP